MDAPIPAQHDGEHLLEELIRFPERFVVFPRSSQPVALALWVIHTHAFAAADTTAYALITSPEKRSGKSRLLEVVELLTACAWRVSGVSEAVLFRKIEKDVPTLLLDEVDAIFGTYAEKTEPIRAAIKRRQPPRGLRLALHGPEPRGERLRRLLPQVFGGDR